MKKLIIPAMLALVIGAACKKTEVSPPGTSQQQPAPFELRESNVPPIQWFDCDATTEEIENTPANCNNCCPNAGCPWMGWDCFAAVVVKGITGDPMAYQDAAARLDEAILQKTTAKFFSERITDVYLLMPELQDSKRSPIFADLKNGVTTVEKYTDPNGRYFYRIYNVRTGKPPSY